MGQLRVQLQFPYDSNLPRDVITLNPYYNGDDAQALAAALDANLKAYAPVGAKPYTIKVYTAGKAPPNYPLATVTQSGTTPNTSQPREIAMCLSYYSTYNRPRFRGRLFLPGSWVGSSSTLRPSTTTMNNVLAFATSVLTKSLPSQMSWIVWSHAEKKSQGTVTDIWCDDEWDIQRRRGLRSTTRVTAKV